MTEEKKELSQADKIWNNIKNTKIELFGLPAQKLETYCTPVLIDPNKLYLSYKIGALLPLLETILGEKYNVELFDKYITITPKR